MVSSGPLPLSPLLRRLRARRIVRSARPSDGCVPAHPSASIFTKLASGSWFTSDSQPTFLVESP